MREIVERSCFLSRELLYVLDEYRSVHAILSILNHTFTLMLALIQLCNVQELRLSRLGPLSQVSPRSLSWTHKELQLEPKSQSQSQLQSWSHLTKESSLSRQR